MKKIIIISGVFAVLIASAGCKKFLDKEPDNRAKLNSPEKVSQLLASAYPQANYQVIAEVSSDNVGDCLTNGQDNPEDSKLNSDLYKYMDNNGDGQLGDNPESYWFACYTAIAASNLALETIDKAADPQNYQAQKGEALVARAYSHFMLVNFFSKFYNAATAASDKGIPYVTSPETVSIKKYDRKTVAYVYDMIEKDLLAGLALIKDESYSVPKYHFNKSAANAFASRFYLYKRDYTNVIKYSKASLPETGIVNYLRPWNTTYQDLINAGTISQTYSSAEEPANLLLVETKSTWLRTQYYAKFGLDDFMANNLVYGSVIPGGGSWSYALYQGIDANHQRTVKTDEFFHETSIGSGFGDAWQMVPLFTAEEVLLNLAEAYTYTGQTDKAATLLNTYLSTHVTDYDPSLDNFDEATALAYYSADPYSVAELQKGIINVYDIQGQPTILTQYYALTDGQKAMINVILGYRESEFLSEGLRWFDVLRYGLVVYHDILDNNSQVIRTITLEQDDPHRVFQIPSAAVDQSGLEPNAR